MHRRLIKHHNLGIRTRSVKCMEILSSQTVNITVQPFYIIYKTKQAVEYTILKKKTLSMNYFNENDLDVFWDIITCIY